jgi:arylsulfatase A-like enzyme
MAGEAACKLPPKESPNVPDRPNILYVFTDQQSAEAMSCAGNADLHTPAMDRLAAEGTRFDRAYTPYPLCTPARASMFTGKFPHEVGVRDNHVPLAPEAVPHGLGHVMSRGGYDAVYAGKWHIPELDIPDGVHGFRKLAGWGDPKATEAMADYFRSRSRAGGEDGGKPFFAVVSYVNPHGICEYGRHTPTPFVDVGEPPSLGDCPNLPANYAIPPHEPEAIRIWRSRPALSIHLQSIPEDWRRYRWGYYRLVEWVDAQLARLLEALDQTGLAENTVVIFSSDHGDHNGAHRLGQKWTFYEESARVPLIVRLPAGRGPRGAVSSHLVNTGIDLGATVCDLAGVAPPADWAGLSWVPLLDGRRLGRWRDHVVSETRLGGPNMDGRMVRTERYKYSVWGRFKNREQLIDVQADPGEMVNLAVESRHGDTLRHHRELLAAWCERTGDDFGKHHGFRHIPFVLPGMEMT